MKFTIYASMTDSFDKQPASSAAEIDEMKRMLTETNPVLLITTVVVSLLHGLFEILAFKVCTGVGSTGKIAHPLGETERYQSLEGEKRDGWGVRQVRLR
jgi:hypothetical protein